MRALAKEDLLWSLSSSSSSSSSSLSSREEEKMGAGVSLAGACLVLEGGGSASAGDRSGKVRRGGPVKVDGALLDLRSWWQGRRYRSDFDVSR